MIEIGFLATIFVNHLETKLAMSTPYHPETNGMTERLNQTLEMYLRCFCSSRPHKWQERLSLAKCWYNISPHTSINMTPFEALYGYKPRMLDLCPYET